MKFDFEYAAKLAKEDPEALERYRQALVHSYIESRPLERREALCELQDELDALREQVHAQDYQRYLFWRMGQNMENLSDRFVHLQSLVTDGPFK